jgi:hypothetical protein
MDIDLAIRQPRSDECLFLPSSCESRRGFSSCGAGVLIPYFVIFPGKGRKRINLKTADLATVAQGVSPLEVIDIVKA